MWWGMRRRRERGLVVPADDPQVESRWVQRPGGQRTREPRQAAEQPPDLSTHTRARVYTRVHANTHVYTLNTRARDTYLLRFTELHVRARALLATHPRLFSSVCARTEGEEEGRDERGRRERMERARSGRGRQKRKQRTRGNVGWLAGLRSPRESLLYANYP